MAEPITYVPTAFSYFSNPSSVGAVAISNAASVLNVPKTAIAAFIAKENNNYETISGKEYRRDRGLDLYVGGLSLLPGSNDDFRRLYNKAVELKLADSVASLTDSQKVDLKAGFPVLADVGPANIKLTTAIRLLDTYIAEHPANDPLDLKNIKMIWGD